MRPLVASLLFVFSGCVHAQQRPAVAAQGEPSASSSAKPAPEKFEFEKYELVLLMRAPKRVDPPPPDIMELQKAHLAHLTKMSELGKMVIAGPLGDQADPSYRGVCLYRVGSLEEARRLAESDPMVQAGWLKVEVMTWYVGKGYMTFPKAPPPKP